MRSGFAACAVVAAALCATPMLPTPAAAQTSPTIGTAVPVVLWAVTGAVIGAVAWPMIVGGGAAAMTPGVMSAGAFLNPGAAVGTVIGGAGYLITR
ncbi:MAG: hypothetical protein WA864_03730 [Acetobacteraceae bacterium]|jgi:mannose/fructose/N-acetylgalactosamine-specific phosphotransferase system component IIC